MAKAMIGGASLTAASYRRVLGANDRIGMALIGSGRRGTVVMRAMLETGRAELSCICDIYDVHRKQARAALTPRASDLFECIAHEEALALRGVDAALIAVPDHLHIEIASAALAAGKNVYLEKPTTHRFPEQEKLRQAVVLSGKVLQCGTQQRSGEHYIRAKEEIFGRNQLGRVVVVRTMWSGFRWQTRHLQPRPQPAAFDWNRFLGPAPAAPFDWARFDSWRYFPDYGNGLVADILTHWADVAQWMMNETHPLNAAATGGIYDPPDRDGRINPDTINVVLKYPGDWNLTFESSVLPLKAQHPTVVFLGTEGSLDISRERYIFMPNKGPQRVVEASRPLEIAHTSDFFDALTKGTKPHASVEIGIQACNPVHLANRAFWDKRIVAWEEFV
jgi:predicted dehydrogenase